MLFPCLLVKEGGPVTSHLFSDFMGDIINAQHGTPVEKELRNLMHNNFDINEINSGFPKHMEEPKIDVWN